jgi:hypothetical protein
MITIEGTVPETFNNGSEFYLKVADKDIGRAAEFISQTNTTFRAGAIAVRKKSIVNNCNAGDTILLTLDTQQRKDGIRLIAVGFKKINPA